MTTTAVRSLARVITLPRPHRGQFGPDHSVVEVIEPDQWPDADPFILLMDDRIDGRPVGGAHPHAGFETVTFLVHGGMGSESGAGTLAPGDVEWTTAGSGIVHGSALATDARVNVRVLQLWLTLPKASRWTTPDHQFIAAATAPVRHGPGVEVRLFSGRTGDLVSTTRNHVPVTLVDLRLAPGASVEQEVPLAHNGFLYPLEGTVQVGADAKTVGVGQVGWLDRRDGDGDGVLRFANDGATPARVLFYAGARQEVPLVSHGPFIGDSREDLVRSYEGFRAGTFRHY